MELDQLRALVTVVDHGTFEAAAAALHITPSAVSQRIKALEVSAGSVLVQRSRPVRPTERGAALLRSARQLLHLADEAWSDLRSPAAGSRPRVRLPIVVNADSIATWFPEALAAIAGTGLVDLEVRRDDEHVTADLLRTGEVMAAVTTEPTPVQGCRARRLGTMVYRAKAARSFVRQWFPDGASPDALAAAPVVHFDRKDRMQRTVLDSVAPGAEPPATFVPDSSQFVAAIRHGVGWGMVPDLQDPRDLLVNLDPRRTDRVELFWQAWKLSSPALDAVTAAVVAAAAAQLHQG
ncbi:LysR family transcriptional regulator ArgP [Intrasporangium calvum]|uniref:Transcriptional regulator, LysR family n=1 Tax=Intrasporangium calvum (strain ATCC 23552 / DSM 43043 / JCM 3097 / NBRC 12989 / NCIMB 10167 / NRRL B-3866 / 7 KIP) TaxID=710696 RepID=E6S9P3_INTC7|nr:LysR family transcriptional regulator ArgP [Intrasporangium calvum]ADU49281.1 transcriptional regulator, LysR family [Intrasporangium calvum DSM 43043]